MPSVMHEALVLLFRNRPALAAELARDVLCAALPPYEVARVGSANLTELKTAKYDADLVVELIDRELVGGIVVEVQRFIDEDKHWSWPSYATVLRAQLRRQVCLVVVAPDAAVARWAAMPIALGGGNWFTPLVLGPAAIPRVTEAAVAAAAPELAVLSAMTHGRDRDAAEAASIAAAAIEASVVLDADRSRLYPDLVLASLSEAARKELISMDPAKYEYQSEFLKRYIALGKAEGKAEGRADLIKRQLTLRFGALTAEAAARISAASIEELDAIGERLLTASALSEALGPE